MIREDSVGTMEELSFKRYLCSVELGLLLIGFSKDRHTKTFPELGSS
jgi:hypothetical protein